MIIIMLFLGLCLPISAAVQLNEKWMQRLLSDERGKKDLINLETYLGPMHPEALDFIKKAKEYDSQEEKNSKTAPLASLFISGPQYSGKHGIAHTLAGELNRKIIVFDGFYFANGGPTPGYSMGIDREKFRAFFDYLRKTNEKLVIFIEQMYAFTSKPCTPNFDPHLGLLAIKEQIELCNQDPERKIYIVGSTDYPEPLEVVQELDVFDKIIYTKKRSRRTISNFLVEMAQRKGYELPGWLAYNMVRRLKYEKADISYLRTVVDKAEELAGPNKKPTYDDWIVATRLSSYSNNITPEAAYKDNNYNKYLREKDPRYTAWRHLRWKNIKKLNWKKGVALGVGVGVAAFLGFNAISYLKKAIV